MVFLLSFRKAVFVDIYYFWKNLEICDKLDVSVRCELNEVRLGQERERELEDTPKFCCFAEQRL